MHLILTGATGRVGSATLNAMLRNPSVTQISILSRSPVPQATDTEDAKRKCNVISHKDFGEMPGKEVLEKLKGAKGYVWAQGISVSEVSPEMYEKITVTWPVGWAKAFAEAAGVGEDKKFNFVYVSGEGATEAPGMFTPRFGQVKGRAERDLRQLSKQQQYSKLRMYSARPGGVDYFDHAEIAPYTQERNLNIGEKLAKPLFPVFRRFGKSMVSPTKELGDALVQLAIGNGERFAGGPGVSGEGRTLSNVKLRQMAGL